MRTTFSGTPRPCLVGILHHTPSRPGSWAFQTLVLGPRVSPTSLDLRNRAFRSFEEGAEVSHPALAHLLLGAMPARLVQG